jgi:hypothetical protein
MQSTIHARLRTLALAAIAFTFTLAGVASAPAVAAPVTETCVAEVSTGFSPAYPAGGSGMTQLGTQSVSGATLQQAASACHAFARKAFAANASWSNPTQFCARYALPPPHELNAGDNSKTRLVWVTDHFQPPGNGVNLVGGYSVVCDGAANVVPISPGPTVEPSDL